MINNLSIPNPCHENWNGMIPQENGRFCGSCQKTVVDFTTKTDQEIIDFITASSGKKLCGTFKKSQLAPITNPVRKNDPKIRFLAAALLVFGMTLFSCNPAEKPAPPPVNEEQHMTGIIIPDLPADSTETKLLKDTTANNVRTTKTSAQFTPPEVITEEPTLTGDLAMPDENITPMTARDTNEVLTIVDQMPEFPGGTGALMKYIQSNLLYPKAAKDVGISGISYISFVVKKDGSIDDVRVLRGIEKSFDEEAIRVVKSMPKWTPGMNKGKKVNVRFNLPVKVNLR